MSKSLKAFDLTFTPEQADVLVPALKACRFPFDRIPRTTGATVPITVADTSRHARAMKAGVAHVHIHNEDGEEAHLLGDTNRRAALGLYWLPTERFPAGRIEVGTVAMDDPDLAREVMLAEVAHAVDYGALSARQRGKILARFDDMTPDDGVNPQGWFEEHGEQNYWAWRGERWMGLFMAAFAPDLPRPLEARQPWLWSYDEADVAYVRRLLKRTS